MTINPTVYGALLGVAGSTTVLWIMAEVALRRSNKMFDKVSDLCERAIAERDYLLTQVPPFVELKPADKEAP